MTKEIVDRPEDSESALRAILDINSTVAGREGKDTGLKVHRYSMFHNHVILFVGSRPWVILFNFDFEV